MGRKTSGSSGRHGRAVYDRSPITLPKKILVKYDGLRGLNSGTGALRGLNSGTRALRGLSSRTGALSGLGSESEALSVPDMRSTALLGLLLA